MVVRVSRRTQQSGSACSRTRRSASGKSDPERKGVAIVIDLAKVEGVLKFGPDGPEFVKLG